MGCFYSKMGPRHTAFSRDLNLSINKRIVDLKPLEDILVSRRSAKGDHLISLLHAARAVSIKLRARDDVNLPTEIDDPIPHETINTWELMADLEEEEDQDEQEQENRDAGDDNIAQTEQRPSSDLADSQGLDLASCAETADLPRQDLSESEQRSKDCAFILEEDTGNEAERRPPMDTAAFGPPEASSSGKTALRRKLSVKDLKLKIPSFDFSSGADHRKWVGDDGHVTADGSYETPRFGSYGRWRGAEHEHEWSGDVFDPELVAELEAALERLTEEEEDALRLIVEECMIEACD